MGVDQRQSKAITLEPKDRSPLSLGGLGSLRRRALSLLDIHWQPRLDCTVLLSQLPGSCQRSRV